MRLRRNVVLGMVFAAATEGSATAQEGRSQRLRLAVMDLSGAALKMQMVQGPVPGGVPQPIYQPQSGPPAQQTSVTIAIPPPAEFARGLTEMLTSVLSRTGRFIVLERAAIAQLEQEQALGNGGKTTKESGAMAGSMLGAQALITGDITGFTFGRSTIGGQVTNVVKGLTVAHERVTAEVIIDLRLIDASSGEVLHAVQGKGKASQTGIAADLIREEKSFSAEATFMTPLGQASRQAIQNGVVGLLTGMPKVRWSGRVVEVNGDLIYLNVAAADGMRPGLELEVFAEAPALIDPATGQVLGSPETPLGKVVVETVVEKFSTARVTAGSGFSRGNVVRRIPGGR